MVWLFEAVNSKIDHHIVIKGMRVLLWSPILGLVQTELEAVFETRHILVWVCRARHYQAPVEGSFVNIVLHFDLRWPFVRLARSRQVYFK